MTQPLIHFNDLQPGEPIEFLRIAALELLDRLLARQPLRGHLARVKHGAFNALLVHRDWYFSLDGNGLHFRYVIRPNLRHKIHQFLTRLRLRTGAAAPKLTKCHTHWARHETKSKLWWQAEMGKVMTHLFGKNQPHIYPQRLFDLVEHQAWREPEFLAQVHTRISRHINQMAIYQPGDLDMCSPDPRTWWLLILAGATDLNARTFPILAFPHCAAALQQLIQHAQSRLKTLEWAGFWDQWLMALVLVQESKAVKVGKGSRQATSGFRLPSENLTAALHAMPLLQTYAPKIFNPDHTSTPVHPHWKRQCPPWFHNPYL